MAWTQVVEQVLDPLRLGANLREIEPRYVKQEPGEPQVRWFQASAQCDLFVWSADDGAVVKAQLFFGWQMVEWSRAHGLCTGAVSEPPIGGVRHAISELYARQSPPDEALVSYARRLLAAANVEEELKSLFGVVTP